MKDIEDNIIKWAQEREILFPANSRNQLLKAFEEMGEVSRAMLTEDREKMKIEIGDVIVTLVILSHNIGFDIETCLQAAWNKIKNRTGITIHGTFIKDES